MNLHDLPPAAAQAATDQPIDLDAFCEAWAGWCATRHYFGPPPANTSPLGKVAKGRPLRASWPNAQCSAEFAAFYTAYQAQPRALDRLVFELHYLRRVRNIKSAAAAVGVGRQHWYTLRDAFRARVYAASRQILSDNMAMRLALAHSHESGGLR